MAFRLLNTFGWMIAGFVLLGSGAAARAADTEVRDFVVQIDGKRSGEAHMSIQRQDNGTTVVNCDTDVKFKVLLGIKTYTYTYNGREVWKDGRLQRLDSTCNDDGKTFAVSAEVDGGKIRVRVNNEEHTTSPDV